MVSGEEIKIFICVQCLRTCVCVCVWGGGGWGGGGGEVGGGGGGEGSGRAEEGAWYEVGKGAEVEEGIRTLWEGKGGR